MAATPQRSTDCVTWKSKMVAHIRLQPLLSNQNLHHRFKGLVGHTQTDHATRRFSEAFLKVLRSLEYSMGSNKGSQKNLV